jgi:hypothetical protein
MQKSVLGVKKQSKDQWDAILWHVPAAKAFVICAHNLGNLIIKIILNATYIRKKQIN